MIKLPPHQQETSRSCGVACLRSILDFHGIKVSEKEILDHNVFPDNMCVLIGLGRAALEFGLKAEYVGVNPMVFRNDKNVSLETLKERVNKQFELGKVLVEQTILFLQKGGTVTLKIPTLQGIKDIIKSGTPQLISVRPALLGRLIAFDMRHYVVPVYYDDENIYYMDPAVASVQKNSNTTFMAAVYSLMPETIIIKK